MSSILKALRKAEEQSPKLDLTMDLLKEVDTRRAVSRRAKGSRATRRILISAVVLVVLGLGTWAALHSRELLPVRVDHRLPITNAEQAPAPKTMIPPSKIEETSAPRAENVAVPPSSVGSVEPVKSPEAPREKVALPPPEKIVEPQPEEVFPRAVKKEQAVSQRPPMIVQESHPEDSKFKLEAIVWSDNPESRFAVVNGQILRKGGSFQGLFVAAIEKDFIAVRTGGRDWTLKFTVE